MRISKELSDASKQAITNYLEYILQQNQKLNLTSITKLDQAYRLHIADSLVPLDYILCITEPNKTLNYCDMGTGAGFPGVPLALAMLDKDINLRAILLDSTAKKIAVIDRWLQDKAIKSHIAALTCRVEEYDNVSKRDDVCLPTQFNIVTARALAKLNTLLELASPLLARNGYFLAYKGKLDNEELEAGHKIAPVLGFEHADTISGDLGGEEERTVLVYKKIKSSEIALPRRVGMAQHKPLIAK